LDCAFNKGDGMKEALKLALEALWTTANPKAEEAITAIKAALAQPAQEPVAWLSEIAKELDDTSLASFGQVATGIRDLKERLTTPPAAKQAQRPWVGMTEAQFLEATRLAENGNYLVAFVRIQEWLKEKNNG
jgi:hypothetical protein